MNLRGIHHEAHSAAQPQPNGDVERAAGVAWKHLSRAALYEATSSPGEWAFETKGKTLRA